MAFLTVNHSLFEILRQEHRRIERALAGAEAEGITLETCQWLWNFVELNHHHQEEILLFSAAANNPRICEGGPFCTLYFDFYLANRPTERVQRRIQTESPIEEHQKIHYETKSPVRIPIDDHRAGKTLLVYLIKNWENLSSEQRRELISDYSEIQRDHINREESCFFHLCSRILTEDQAGSILSQWRQISESG